MTQVFSKDELRARSQAEYDELRIKAVRDYLADIKETRRIVKLMAFEVEELTAKLEGVDGIRYDTTRVKSSPSDDKIPFGISELIERKEALGADTARLEEEVRVARALLYALDGEQGVVLRLKHVLGMPTAQIAEALDRSESTVFLREREGLLQMYELGIPTRYRIPEYKAV